MAKYLKVVRVKDAVINLCNWRGAVKQQSSAHLLPLLALLEKGVNSSSPVVYEEDDDFSFFNRYCKFGLNQSKPYFDPFARELRIASHPHSNIATARKNTFQNRWRAASSEMSGGATTWKLSDTYAQIFSEKLFPKSGARRVNALDVAAWLFREESFSDDANSEELLEKFRGRFPMRDQDFDLLFAYAPEPSANLFQNEPPDPSALGAAISSLDLSDAGERVTREASRLGEPRPVFSPLSVDDPVLTEIKGLLSLGTSGIILRGAPGTGKSWYADKVAMTITGGDRARIFRIQFHPSFTYEDFFDGYVPSESTSSGFAITGKIFRAAIEMAAQVPDPVILIIDEINRGNTAKIFGEALTYIEHGWRDIQFVPRLRNEPVSIPRNLLILATMNPHDRSITPLDMALLRRFDHVDVPPSPEVVMDFLAAAGMDNAKANIVGGWFEQLQSILPFGLGHTFLLNVGDVGQLGLVWRYRILPFCQSVLEHEPERLAAVKSSYEALEQRLRDAQD